MQTENYGVPLCLFYATKHTMFESKTDYIVIKKIKDCKYAKSCKKQFKHKIK